MKRREFITLVGGTAAAWPIAARAQRPGVAYMPKPWQPLKVMIAAEQALASRGVMRLPLA